MPLISTKSKRAFHPHALTVAAAAISVGGLGAASAAAAQYADQTIAAPTVTQAAAASTVYWAVVNVDGTLARGSPGVTSLLVGKAGRGEYEVDFPARVDQCAYTATTGYAFRDNPPPAFAAVASRGGNLKGVFVATYDATGKVANIPFHMIVAC